jgi:hypothetical protein
MFVLIKGASDTLSDGINPNMLIPGTIAVLRIAR